MIVGEPSHQAQLRHEVDLTASLLVLGDDQRLLHVSDFDLVLVLVVLSVRHRLLLLGDVKSVRRRFLKVDGLNPVLMLVGAVDSSHRDSLEFLHNIFRTLLLDHEEFLDRLKKGVLPDHFVSNVQLDNWAIFKVLKCGEEARPDLQRIDGYAASWINKVATCANSLKFHHTHDSVEDDLEELVDFRIVAGDSFSPSEDDLVDLTVVLHLHLNRILHQLGRVDAVSEVKVSYQCLGHLLSCFSDQPATNLRVIGHLWHELD